MRPTVYEINTAVWLRRLGCTLGDVPAAEWDALAALPVDAVWLMGVWERSPAGLAIAEADPGLDAGNRAALPDLRPEDVIGSPYCVRDYVVDERFGDLAAARAELAARGLKLILDYVPNHVAPDHPWTVSRPGCFVAGSEEDFARDPSGFLRTEAGVFARGRDPYFPPWPDVVQLNAFSEELREAVAETLLGLADQCDGLFGRHRFAEHVALGVFAAELIELGRIGFLLGAFGDHVHAKVMRQRDDRAQDHRARALAGRAHERLIDLDRVEREALQVGKRRMPGAEIVERKADAEIADTPKHLRGIFGVLHHQRLGQLQLERAARET